MPFDNGNVSFAVCRLPQPIPREALSEFAEKKAHPLTSVLDEPQTGWVSGRHLLETRIDDETGMAGGYLHLYLRSAVRKIPASLFAAQVRLEELTQLQAKKANFLSRKEKKEIRDELKSKLIKDMPPHLSGIPFVGSTTDDLLFLGATSPAQIDSFLGYFYETLKFEPIPLGPEAAADIVCHKPPHTLPGLAFYPRPGREPEPALGRDFLTWLWFQQETEKGTHKSARYGEFSWMVDGPLTFAPGNADDCESTVRKGLPTMSAEAHAALVSGKKLRRAKLMFVRDDDQWNFTLEADSFIFKGLKLPAGEELDPGSHFQERIQYLRILQEVFFELYGQFLDELQDPARREALQPKLKAWVESLQR